MMKETFQRKRFLRGAAGQRGIGLIDVLLAVVVLGLGAVGLVKFQSVVMREGNSAKARSVAVQLAKAKLDDLRSYSQLDAGAAGVFGYDELGPTTAVANSNVGGAEKADGTLELPTGTVTVGGGWTTPGPGRPRATIYALTIPRRRRPTARPPSRVRISMRWR